MDQKKIDKLYELLEQAEEELDDEAVAGVTEENFKEFWQTNVLPRV